MTKRDIRELACDHNCKIGLHIMKEGKALTMDGEEIDAVHCIKCSLLARKIEDWGVGEHIHGFLGSNVVLNEDYR